MKKGFTLLEVLVASLLLGMLVTILTMVFNQSSVAWRIGVASVVDLDDKRQGIAAAHSLADAALPNADPDSPSAEYRVVSPWKKDGEGIRDRAVEQIDKSQLGNAGIDIAFNRPDQWIKRPVGGSMTAGNMKSYLVGVASAGPDRRFGTRDDISNLPKEASK